MSDKFFPITMQELTSWIFTELEEKESIFGVPQRLFFVPHRANEFKTEIYGQKLETPFGVAAGPHSQMAQNIIVAWLCGARFIELKTVQTLDELEVSKPCIDMLDAGYNVEWSQELKLGQSFDEYLRAWVLIHALHRKFEFYEPSPGIIFNLSVGYNLEGILKPNVQEFLSKMQNAGELLHEYIDIVAKFCPEVKNIEIPSCLSNNITLSTMHGCPPDEIGKIASYLIEEKGLHTNVKLNPTLLGPEELRHILNEKLGYREITVPDIAFEHDLKYPDAVSLIKDLQQKADTKGVTFGVKLSNTLEVENHLPAFDKKDEMMYLSGRPLHAITVNLASKLSQEFNGQLLMSFAGGVDCFNIDELLACGMRTITVSSDILRPGGYLRMLQYIDAILALMDHLGVKTLDDLIIRSVSPSGRYSSDISKCALFNLEHYANRVLSDFLLLKDSFERKSTKTERELKLFDCIKAPCTDGCPIDQKVPLYIEEIKKGNLEKAAEIIRTDNPIPSILGRACNHVCETICIRAHYDEPIAIRELKRFVIDKDEKRLLAQKAAENDIKVGVIGAGPCGLSVAYFLALQGFSVTIFEEKQEAAGMVSQTLPLYRATQESIDLDMEMIKKLGIEIRYGQKIGRDTTFADLKKEFKYTVIAVGAKKGMPLGIAGENSDGVIDGIEFLRQARINKEFPLGKSIGVIGGGDVAMDCARVANRLSEEGNVFVIYRRSVEQMPAQKEELEGLLYEEIDIMELVSPIEVLSKNGHIYALRCSRMRLGKPDASGRKRPVEIPNSDFDIPLDNLITAIGQLPDFSFLETNAIKLNAKGYIEINPDTSETSVKGVYAGGDAVQKGPSTIVKACRDGKIIADSIIQKETGIKAEQRIEGEAADIDYVKQMKERAYRKFRVPIYHLPARKRDGFGEILLPLEDKLAKEESERCLGCHLLCNTCVTVCPNRAAFSYKIEPVNHEFQIINSKKTESFVLEQKYQTAIFTPFCNECGNCTVFCPTSGKPYQDKPRIYNDWNDFNKETDNAFIIGENSIKAKFEGQLHELMLSDQIVIYKSPGVNVRLDKDSFELLKNDSSTTKSISLKNCAIMYYLLKGITNSLPGLPEN